MNREMRNTMLLVLCAVQGLLLALIGLAGFDGLHGFAGGFGLVMIFIPVVEWISRRREASP